jgi:AraC-like DNA-binding protein
MVGFIVIPDRVDVPTTAGAQDRVTPTKRCPLTITFDTAQIPAADRAEIIREAIWRNVVKVHITHQDDARRIRATGQIRSFGSLTACSVRSNATTIRRTPRLTGDDSEPSLFLGLQVSGSSMVIQGGRQAVLRPGDLALYDTTVPYTLLNEDGIHQHYFRIPRADIGLPMDVISRITAVRLDPRNPVADIAAGYFARLAVAGSPLDGAAGAALQQPSVELLRALITTQLCEDAVDPMHEALVVRILEFARAHLADRDLSAGRIAAAHHISVRQLYVVLAGAEIGLGDWIRAQRLERCRQELSAPLAATRTIAAIAGSWGFADATHFSRVFRDAYGLSPRQWRQRAVDGRRPPTTTDSRTVSNGDRPTSHPRDLDGGSVSLVE